MTPNLLEAAIAKWVPEEAVEAVRRYLATNTHRPTQLVCAAYQAAIAPLLARAVDDAVEAAINEAEALAASDGKVTEAWDVTDREGIAEEAERAFRAVLTQAKSEGRGR